MTQGVTATESDRLIGLLRGTGVTEADMDAMDEGIAELRRNWTTRPVEFDR